MSKSNFIAILVLVGFSIHAYAQSQLNILSFNGDTGYKHDSKPMAAKMIEDFGAENNWKITATADPAIFTTTNLSQFDVIVFNNNCGADVPIFNTDEGL